jgi:hypothetical protein
MVSWWLGTLNFRAFRKARVHTVQGDTIKMKKIMSLMLGLSLVLGIATVSFAKDATTTTTKTKKAKKAKTSSTTATTK